ncbi:MAG: ATP-binding protein, partial [Odoribacter sp.]
FITLYNQLEEHCGIVMCATDHLQKRIKRGLKLNKKGYKEIFSRIGRKFVELDGVCTSDVVSICIDNGITDKTTIKEIIEDCEWDLRRVKRKIHALKQLS